MYPTLGIDFVRQRLESATRRAEQAALLRDLALARPKPAARGPETCVASGQPGRSTQCVVTTQAVACC